MECSLVLLGLGCSLWRDSGRGIRCSSWHRMLVHHLRSQSSSLLFYPQADLNFSEVRNRSSRERLLKRSKKNVRGSLTFTGKLNGHHYHAQPTVTWTFEIWIKVSGQGRLWSVSDTWIFLQSNFIFFFIHWIFLTISSHHQGTFASNLKEITFFSPIKGKDGHTTLLLSWG